MLVRLLGLEDTLEEGMETHSSILAWEIPWAEEPGGLQSIGSQRVRHDWSDLAYDLLLDFETRGQTSVLIHTTKTAVVCVFVFGRGID